MKGKNYNVIGVMSGTSLDGIDLAYAKITTGITCSGKITLAETIPYTPEWMAILQEAVGYDDEKLEVLNIKYTAYLAEVINTFITKHKLQEIDAVCSHGHTILHQPENGYTLQIGNLPEIATYINQKVVCDFRVQDVQLGGQGAPLVPIGDQLLFGEYDYCLNLGGFANVSMQREGTRVAYDICAVNTVLNVYAQKLGKMYDDRGAFAKAGKINTTLLEKLNAPSFFKQPPPKSLGIEWVHEVVFPLLEQFELTPEDQLATFTEHIAIQLATQFETKVSVLVTGGGAYNEYLLERVRSYESVHLIVPEKEFVEFKEALVFGLLGVLRLEGKTNTLASVTGASRDHSAGVIYVP